MLSDMSSIAVVAPIRYGAYAEARRLIGEDRPFDSERTPRDRHQVFLTGNEAIFVFEGANARAAVEELVGDVAVSKTALAWRHCLAGRPRIADDVYGWRQ